MRTRFISFALLVSMSLTLSPLRASDSKDKDLEKAEARFYGVLLMILGSGFGIKALSQLLTKTDPSVTFTSKKLKMHTGEEISWGKIRKVSIGQEYLPEHGNVKYCVIKVSPNTKSLINKNKELLFPQSKRDDELYVVAFDVDKPLEEFLAHLNTFKQANAAKKKDPTVKPLDLMQFRYGRRTPTSHWMLGTIFFLGFGNTCVVATFWE